MSDVVAYVGLGSNLGAAEAQVLQAFDELERLPRTRVAARSSLYRSAPLGFVAQPEFVNAAARLVTALDAQALLEGLHAIERNHGRERPFPDAPRTLDLDLLLYGAAVIDAGGLRVPHPRAPERAVVLLPLTELDPDAEIPGHGRAAALLRACAAQSIVRIA